MSYRESEHNFIDPAGSQSESLKRGSRSRLLGAIGRVSENLEDVLAILQLGGNSGSGFFKQAGMADSTDELREFTNSIRDVKKELLQIFDPINNSAPKR